MTTLEQEQPITLGYLAGRIEGQETQLQALQAGQQELRAALQQLNNRIDKLFYAIIGLGIGVIGLLGGGLITLIIQNGVR